MTRDTREVFGLAPSEEKERLGLHMTVLGCLVLFGFALAVVGLVYYHALSTTPEPDKKLVAELTTAERGDFLVRSGNGVVFHVVMNVVDGLNITLPHDTMSGSNVWKYDVIASRMPDARVVKFPSCEWTKLAAKAQGVDPKRIDEWQKSCQ